MTLSDHLQKARLRRLVESGVLSSEHALAPEPEPEPEPVVDEEPAGLFAPITIEARPAGLHLVPGPPLVDLTELTELPDTPSSVCPNCNGVGRLDMVDLVGHTMHHTCETCGTMWQTRQPAPPRERAHP